MTLIATADAARVNRRRGSAPDGVTFWHTLYLGTSRYNMAPGTPDPDAGALFPMAFLVEQDPGSTAQSHYHQQDQFQLVVGGCGTLGLHDIKPVTVHFTAAHTAYGPIRASQDEGVWYFTLRNGFDPGARFMTMPENRAALRTVKGRAHREAVAGPLAAPSTPAETLIGPETDGMGAWRYTLPPNGRVTGLDPVGGRGQYWVVTKGSLAHAGQAMDRLSCAFVYPDDAAFEAEAGPEGAEVIAMQFPHRVAH
ncbi:MAG TPA: hypothetical protein VHB27_12550 [Rhodopila sp.]|uniref:hypothetical protein n=1 Tax=Rhodopila sp. TaxID=2480087 RepID=UPI002B5B8BCB|nr:hypothetical protein [Rhodopila sp.]HVY16048.1 hypothetical protein [Rhodopila sp.]